MKCMGIKGALTGMVAAGLLYLGVAGIGVPKYIEHRINAPEISGKYTNAIRGEIDRKIDERIKDLKIRETTRQKTKDKFAEITRNGRFETDITESPSILSPLERFNPEKYGYRVSLRDGSGAVDRIANFGILKASNGDYELKEGSIQVNESSALVQELTDTAESAATKEYMAKNALWMIPTALVLGIGALLAGRAIRNRRNSA